MLNKKTKQQKKIQKSFKKFVIFSQNFIPLSINIGLYFYNVKIQVQY
jgi:hypothetical protein